MTATDVGDVINPAVGSWIKLSNSWGEFECFILGNKIKHKIKINGELCDLPIAPLGSDQQGMREYVGVNCCQFELEHVTVSFVRESPIFITL